MKYSRCRDKLREIYEETDIKEFVENAVINVCDNLLYGIEIEKITGDDIVDLLRDNADKIQKISGYEITDFEAIERYFEEGDGKEILDVLFSDGGLIEFIKELVPDLAELFDSLPILDFITTVLLVGTIMMVLLSLVMALLIFLVRAWDPSAFCWNGVVCILSALPLLLAALLGPIFTVSVGGLESVFVTLIKSVFADILNMTLIFTVLGILLIAVYVVIRIVQSRKKKVY